MAEAGFKLPGDSYDQVVRILRGYAVCKEPTSPGEVAKKLATDQTVVSRNNAFLVSVGILEGGAKKGLTELGKRLAHALEHSLDEEIGAAWAEVVEENDFLQGIVSAVRIRNGMDSSALVSHIAYSAGVTKSPRTTAGARTMVEILKAARILAEEDGKLVVSRMPPSTSRTEQKEPSSERDLAAPAQTSATRRESLALGPGLTVSIEVRVSCSVDEIAALGPKLRELFKTLRESPESEV